MASRTPGIPFRLVTLEAHDRSEGRSEAHLVTDDDDRACGSIDHLRIAGEVELRTRRTDAVQRIPEAAVEVDR